MMVAVIIGAIEAVKSVVIVAADEGLKEILLTGEGERECRGGERGSWQVAGAWSILLFV